MEGPSWIPPKGNPEAQAAFFTLGHASTGRALAWPCEPGCLGRKLCLRLLRGQGLKPLRWMTAHPPHLPCQRGGSWRPQCPPPCLRLGLHTVPALSPILPQHLSSRVRSCELRPGKNPPATLFPEPGDVAFAGGQGVLHPPGTWPVGTGWKATSSLRPPRRPLFTPPCSSGGHRNCQRMTAGGLGSLQRQNGLCCLDCDGAWNSRPPLTSSWPRSCGHPSPWAHAGGAGCTAWTGNLHLQGRHG